jgi:uncharacterized protein (DUF2141 family)
MTKYNTPKTALRTIAGITTLTAASVFFSSATAANLTVTIADVATAEGEIMLVIYDSENNFRKTETIATRKPAIKGNMVFSFPDLTAGDYALMVFHDRNGNGELDTNLMGMPKEPWGGSLQGKSVFGAPGWSDTRFELADDGTSITITLN